MSDATRRGRVSPESRRFCALLAHFQQAINTSTNSAFVLPFPSKMALIERARAVGMCPPSLLKDYGNGEEYGKFEAAVNRVLDASGTSVVRIIFSCRIVVSHRWSRFVVPPVGFFISSDPSAAKEFQSLLQVG